MTKDPFYEYHLVELDPHLQRVKSSHRVLVENKKRRYNNFTSWTDDLLLFEERFDSNSDGKVDYTDERNEIVHALDLRTGEILPVLSEPARRVGMGGSASGEHIYFLEEVTYGKKYVLRVVDTKTSRCTDLAVLGDGRYSCLFDSACRFAVCRRTGKNLYSWEDDRTSIYRIDLPTLS